MGIFEHFPYVNMHNINMDWIINKIKGNAADIETIEGNIEALKTVSADADIIFTEDASENVTCNKTFAQITQLDQNDSICSYKGFTSMGYTQIVGPGGVTDRTLVFVFPVALTIASGTWTLKAVTLTMDFAGIITKETVTKVLS